MMFTTKILGVLLALSAFASAAPPRSTRSLEPPGYKPPCNCHQNEQQPTLNEASPNEYLPPTENAQSGNALVENEVATERNLEYLPPLELGPVVEQPAEEPKLQEVVPENEASAGGNVAENQAPELPEEAPEYLPPDNNPQSEGPISLKLSDEGSQAEAVADGENAQVSTCVNGRCEEKQSRTEPEGYSYPKPAAPFELPTVEIARTLDEELPKETGCKTCSQQSSAAKSRTNKREAARISSVSTDPSAGPVSISTLPFLVNKNTRPESTDYQVVRNRRDLTAQTKPGKTGTAQTLPAKIGTAQTLPAKNGAAQTLPAKTGAAQPLPGRHRRDSKKATTYPSQKEQPNKAQTLPGKIGTAQTLPAKIGTAQTLPAKIGTAQTQPAKIGTAQTLPAKISGSS